MNKFLNRVPEIMVLYWVLKIASTTLGETGADMFSMTFNLGYASTVFLFLGVFAVCLFWKLKLRCYEPITYWLTFTSSAIAGTAISDFIDRTLGLGYVYGSLMLLGLLCGVLACWYWSERSLSVESVVTFKAELYYWTAFLIANTLGTAVGDFLADYLEIGFLYSALILSIILVAIALLHYVSSIPGVLLFWFAFVLTRPFGATFGDFLTKTHTQGGLDLGTIGASACFTLVLLLALWQAVKQHRQNLNSVGSKV